MAWTSTELETNDGAKLHLFKSLPTGKLKGVIQINHGMAEHAGRYERFAMALADAGYAAYAHDHRGHGKTIAPDSAPGLFAKKDGWDKVLADVASVTRHIRSIHGETPIICFGHSMGSIIGFNHILRQPNSVQGAALWNSGVETGALTAIYRGLLKTERFFKGSDVPSGIANKLTFDAWNKAFAPNRTAFDWLSRDEAEVDKYVTDPDCGFEVTISLWLDVLNGIYFAANDKNLASLPKSLPVHLQAGAEDPCSEKGKAVAHVEQRMKSAGLKDVTFTLKSNTRHEALNEINRDEITLEFVQWLDERFGG